MIVIKRELPVLIHCDPRNIGRAVGMPISRWDSFMGTAENFLFYASMATTVILAVIGACALAMGFGA